MAMLATITLVLMIGSLDAEVCQVDSTNVTQNVTKVDDCNQQWSKRYMILTIFCAVVCFTALAGNSITVLVITQSPHLRRRSSFLLLASLALSDIGVSSFVTTVKVDMYYHNGSFCHGLELCVLFQITDSLFVITSLTHLLVLAVDRWYAVTKPYHYIRTMTRKKAKIIILSIWGYSLMWMLLGLFKWEYPVIFSYELIQVGGVRYCQSYNRTYFTTLVLIIYVIPMCIMVKLNIFTVHVARKTSKSEPKPSAFRNSRSRKKTSLDMSISSKAIRTVGMVITAYVISWLPHVVIIIIQYWWVCVLVGFYRSHPSAYDIITAIISNILPTLNSCINPLIYCVFSEDFRRAFRELVQKWIRMSNHGQWGSQMSQSQVVQPRGRKMGVSVMLEPIQELCDTDTL